MQDTGNLTIDFSSNESESFGLRVGRCTTREFQGRQFVEQLTAGAFDICRLKTPGTAEDIHNQLEGTGLPFYFSGAIRRYRSFTKNLEKRPYKNEGVTFELYEGQRREVLESLIKETWGQYPIGYYKTPYISRILDKELEIDCLARFYAEVFDHRKNPNKQIYFQKFRGEDVGYFSIQLSASENALDSTIGGVRKAYQNRGFFNDMIRFVQNFASEHQISWFYTGARSENLISQKTIEKEKFKVIGTEYVFHIPSFLNHSATEPLSLSIPGHISRPAEIHQFLLQALPLNIRWQVEAPLNIIQSRGIQLRKHHGLPPYTGIVTCPILSEEDALCVVKVYDAREALVCLFYFDLRGEVARS